MPYEAMIATALALPGDTPEARVARWRQLVDLFAQMPVETPGYAALETSLQAEHFKVAGDVRRSAAAALGGRRISPGAARLFGNDDIALAVALLPTMRVARQEWAPLIAQLPSPSRAVLRNRRDLPRQAVEMLARFSASDSVLPSLGVADATSAQIRELVARIEAYRERSPGALAETPAPTAFTFETSIDGIVDWVDGVERGALIGVSLAEPVASEESGVDAHAAAAFRRRAPFRNARLLVAGQAAAAGLWVISGTPIFNPETGRFTGFHGHARRMRPDEDITHGRATAQRQADSLRQLVHELRTPLNAIVGFSEMIERQLLGPVGHGYRLRAQAISSEAQGLVEVIADLDQAARNPDAGQGDVLDHVDLSAVAADVLARLHQVARARDIVIDAAIDRDAQVITIDRPSLDRMMSRLFGTLLALTRPGERIIVRLVRDERSLRLAVIRPAVLRLLPEASLFDPVAEIGQELPDAPILGLGFTLRLVARIARRAGGRFVIEEDAFVVVLPAADVVEGFAGES